MGTGQGDGGAIYSLNDVSVKDSVLTQNMAGVGTPGGLGAGGAIDANSATSANPLGNLELINSTLTQNTAAQGGAINADAGSSPINLALFLTTVAGNTAPSASNIRYLGNMTTPPTLTMAGAIVALPNGGGQNCAAIPAGTVNFDNRGGNLTDGSSGPGLSCSIGSGTNDTSGTNPMLGPLVNNGGPTLTMAIQQQGTVKSQAFNRVPALVCAGFTTDQRGTGFTRPQGGACDSGAFEARLFTLTVTPAGAGTGTVTGAGISCGSDCSESYLEGTSVPLTATPAGDSSFAGYSGSCSGATCTLAMSQNRAVTATFDLLPVDQTQPITQPPTSPGTTIPAPPCRPGFKLKTVKKHGKKRKRCVKKKKKKKK
jgi:hypothetical protein